MMFSARARKFAEDKKTAVTPSVFTRNVSINNGVEERGDFRGALIQILTY